jgi:hypothetical protein
VTTKCGFRGAQHTVDPAGRLRSATPQRVLSRCPSIFGEPNLGERRPDYATTRITWTSRDSSPKAKERRRNPSSTVTAESFFESFQKGLTISLAAPSPRSEFHVDESSQLRRAPERAPRALEAIYRPSPSRIRKPEVTFGCKPED